MMIKVLNLFLLGVIFSGFVCSQPEDLFPLTIIHINDLHARYDDINDLAIKCKPEIESCFGGYARNVAIIKQLQAEAANSIYLNAGDNYFGTLYYEIFKFNVTATMLNVHRADAITLGNHEFDDRVAGLVPFLDEVESPMVISNIDVTDEPKLQGKYQETLILERGGRKIGIIGVLLKSTPELSFTEKVKFLDEEIVIVEKATELRSQNVDIVIVLSHCGLSVDKKLAASIGEHVHVIVSSHSHTLLYNGTPPSNDKASDEYPVVVEQSNGKKTLIVQALAFSKYVGHLKVFFDTNNQIVRWEGNPVWAGPNIPKDEDVLAALAPYKSHIDAIGNTNIGSTLLKLDKDACSTKECDYGNLINDAYVDYYVNFAENGAWTNASIAITNAGIIRLGINSGNITIDDLAASHPYENTVDTFDIRGADLRQALEVSASNYGTVNFLQFSGMKVVFNVTAPVGQRVKSMKIRCNTCSVPYYFPIGVNESYRIAIASWIGDGGNGYTIFRETRRNLIRGPPSIDVVERYIKKISPIASMIDERIQILQ